MIRSHKLLSTLGTLKTLLTGVSPTVPLKLIGSSKLLAAEYPTADERPFARVPA